MKIPIFASFLLLAGVIYTSVKTSNKKIKEEENAFWEKERKANSVRKKSLDHLDYVHIPDDFLSIANPSKNIVIEDSINHLHKLAEVPIVNLSGITNTDLKLTYGTANITILSEYDEHYTQLAILLQHLADELYEENRHEECLRILEFAVSTGTDISHSYYMLATLYQENDTPEKINDLIEKAKLTRSTLKDTIIQNLQEFTTETAYSAV